MTSVDSSEPQVSTPGWDPASVITSWDDGIEVVQVTSRGQFVPLLERTAAIEFQSIRARERAAHRALIAEMDRKFGEPLRREYEARAPRGVPSGVLKQLWLAVRAAADAELAHMLARRAFASRVLGEAAGAAAEDSDAGLWTQAHVAARAAAGYTVISFNAFEKARTVAASALPPRAAVPGSEAS